MIYTVFYKGRIDLRTDENHKVQEHIEEMLNFQDCKLSDIQVRKDGELLMLEANQIWSVSVGGR